MILAADLFVFFILFRFFQDRVPLLVAISATLLVVFYGLARAYIHWRASRIYHLSSVSEELVLTLDEQGITQQSKVGETKLAWDEVFRVRENKTCYFVFLSPNKAFYFPKRNFESKEQQDAFLDMIIEYVEPIKIRFKH